MLCQVIVPMGLLRRVDSYLRKYLSQKSKTKKSLSDFSVSRSSSSSSLATEEGLFEQPEPLASSKSVMDKILWRRSLQLHDQQHCWQVTHTNLELLPVPPVSNCVYLFSVFINIDIDVLVS